MKTALTRLRLTIDDFVHLYHREGPFEIIDGERHARSPTVMGHNAIAGDLHLALNNYALEKGLGRAYMEAPSCSPKVMTGNGSKARVCPMSCSAARRVFRPIKRPNPIGEKSHC